VAVTGTGGVPAAQHRSGGGGGGGGGGKGSGAAGSLEIAVGTGTGTGALGRMSGRGNESSTAVTTLRSPASAPHTIAAAMASVPPEWHPSAAQVQYAPHDPLADIFA
jgi:hypothetical protein